jgi:hypothetical protein
MKRLAAIVAFAIVGIVTARIAAEIVLGFAPVCGYECDNRSIATLCLITAGCLIAFPALGQMFTRGARLTLQRCSIVTAVLIEIVLLAAGCFYVFELHRHYADAEAARPVEADFDYMFMTIATRDVQTYTDAANGPVKRAAVVRQWQRCALDGAWCDKNPTQAHMHCKTGEVYVSEDDWHAFTLIPGENVYGAVPLRSMDLCAAGNHPDE